MNPKVGAGALIVVVMTIAAYTPALEAGFIWDDDDYVTENPLLGAPDGLSRIWFSMDAPSQYVPLVYTTLRAEYAVWGLEPFGYHLVNVLLHAANALLVWLLLARLDVPAAWLAAAVFALHPVHVESVAWISERKNVLSLFFSLGSLLAWLQLVRGGSTRPTVLYALSLGLYCLALFSKATASTLPAAMLLVPWMRGIPLGRRHIVLVLPFFGLGIAMGLVVLFWERFHIGTLGERFALAWVESSLVASRACFFYIEKLAWPAELTFSYPRFEIDATDPTQYGWLISGALLLAVLWLSRRTIGRAPIAVAALFVATLSPVLGFIPLYTFWYTFVADHYQYVASIGPIALAIGVAAHSCRRLEIHPRVRRALAGALLLALATATYGQSQIYMSPETLWKDTTLKNPDSWMAFTNLGRYYVRSKRFDEAIPAFEAALQLRPETYRAHVGIGNAMKGLDREGGMLRHYEEALAIEPNLTQIRRHVARLQSRRGDWEAAIVHYQIMVKQEPQSPQARWLLGQGLDRLGRQNEARVQYERALALDPNLVAPRRALERHDRSPERDH